MLTEFGCAARGPQPIAAINHFVFNNTVSIAHLSNNDRITKPVRLDALCEGREAIVRHHRKDVGRRMNFHATLRVRRRSAAG